MPTPTSASTDPDDVEEARFRARMARVSLGSISGSTGRPQEGEGQVKGSFRLGWLGWLVIDALVVVGTVAVVVVWTPVQSCRAQDKSVGFYAGETVQGCIRRGVVERIANADQRIKMMLRGSGH